MSKENPRGEYKKELERLETKVEVGTVPEVDAEHIRMFLLAKDPTYPNNRDPNSSTSFRAACSVRFMST